MKEEHIRYTNTKYFGMIHSMYMDIVPYSYKNSENDIECAQCRRLLSWSKSYPYFIDHVDHNEVIYGSKTTKLLYCFNCKHRFQDKINNIFEIRVRSNLDVDSFYRFPIKYVSCTSFSNIDEVMNYVRIFHRDNSNYYRELVTCKILPNGYMPYHLRELFIAKRVIRKLKTIVMRKKVAYVLYKCIPYLDKETAISLANIVYV